jgi:hypothetical protein
MGILEFGVIATVLVAGGGLAFWKFSGRSKEAKALPITQIPEHIAAVAKIRTCVRTLSGMSADMTDGSTAVLVADLALLASRIANELERDPRDIVSLRPFVDYHAEKSVEVIGKYIEVQKQPPSLEREEALESAIQALREDKPLYEAFYNKSLGNDVADLEIMSESKRRIGRMERPV